MTNRIFALFSAFAVIFFFQNCGTQTRLQFGYVADESIGEEAVAKHEVENRDDLLVVLESPGEKTSSNNLNNISFEIADTHSQDIWLTAEWLKQSVQANQRAYQEIYLPKIKIRKSKSFELNKLRTEVRVSLIKSMVTSDTVAFPGGGFNVIEIANKPITASDVFAFDQDISGVTEQGTEIKLHDLRLELSSFLMGNSVKYGSGYYKIDYAFPDVNYKKSTIFALQVYKDVPGGRLYKSELEQTLSGSYLKSDSLGNYRVCSVANANGPVYWKSQNSPDECSGVYSGLGEPNQNGGWTPGDYVRSGRSITLHGSNELKFLGSGAVTTIGSVVLKCTDDGWVIESKSCKNRHTLDNFPKVNRLTFDYNSGPRLVEHFVTSLKHE